MMKNYKVIVIALLILLGLGVVSYFLTRNNSIDITLTKAEKYDGNVTYINLTDMTYNGTGLVIENGTIYIAYGGTYNLTGSTTSNIVIDVLDDADVILELNNISIINDTPINILNGDVTIDLLSDTKNYVEYTRNYNEQDDYDSAIYSSDDILITGEGTLEIKSSYNGITSKDKLTIESGNLIINASNNAIKGKDYVEIIDGTFDIQSGNDAIKSTNDTDTSLGYIKITNGNFKIKSSGDAIDAYTDVIILNGNYDIETGNGYTKTSKTNSFGMFQNQESSDSSIKGIKAGSNITINNGKFTLNTEDDGIHANGNITIINGSFTIKSSDGIHADGLLQIDDGTFDIEASEGLEATYILINDGDIKISATDDGINAANKSKNYDTTIEIKGGDIEINMASGDTDGIDSNGNLYIKGGNININCNSPFDYDGEGKYTGGTLTVNGKITTTLTNQMMGGNMGGNMPLENFNNMGKTGRR